MVVGKFSKGSSEGGLVSRNLGQVREELPASCEVLFVCLRNFYRIYHREFFCSESRTLLFFVSYFFRVFESIISAFIIIYIYPRMYIMNRTKLLKCIFFLNIKMYSPTTIIDADLISVWNNGASADTSHVYSPATSLLTSVSVTRRSSESET